jgi:hypothetical protein
MKLRLVTLAALAAVSGHVFAANTTPVTAAEAAAAAEQVNISGSSAAKGIIAGLVKQNCQTGSFVTFNGPNITAPYAGGTTISGSVGNAYACRAAATNDWGVAEDTVVVVNKRDFLGSGHGVFPVAQNAATEFIDLTTCDDASKNCTGTVSKVPHAGISDEEPTLFNGPFNRPYAFSSAPAVTTSDFGSVSPVFSQVFGVAVTNKLAAEMIAAGNYVVDGSGNQVPSLTSAQIANLFSQSVKSIGWKSIVTDANKSVGVNICTRDIGSGTRAAINTIYLQNGLNGLSPFLAKPSQANVATAQDTAGKFYINEAGSGGGVVSCLNTVNGLSKGFGVGLLTLGQGVGTSYVFAAIDGVLPSRDNAKVGKYGAWVESTMQTNLNATGVNFAGGTLSTGALNFLKSFVTKATYADNLGQVGMPAIAGVFALPTAGSTDTTADCSAYTGAYPVKGSASLPVDGADAANYFCSRFSRNANSTKLPKFVK